MAALIPDCAFSFSWVYPSAPPSLDGADRFARLLRARQYSLDHFDDDAPSGDATHSAELEVRSVRHGATRDGQRGATEYNVQRAS